MKQPFLPSDLQFKESFDQIVSSGSFSDYVKKISNYIKNSNLDTQTLEQILLEFNIPKIEDIKGETLDLLLSYINLILEDNFISEDEAKNIKLLKRVLKIKEGDFYNFRYNQIKEILDKQFQFIYSDNQISSQEALHKVGLQELFDLSYDQFLELVDKEVRSAIERGANPKELDTVFLKAYQIEKIRKVHKKWLLTQSLLKIFRKK